MKALHEGNQSIPAHDSRARESYRPGLEFTCDLHCSLELGKIEGCTRGCEVVVSHLNIKRCFTRKEFTYRIDVIPASSGRSIQNLNKGFVSTGTTKAAEYSRDHCPLLPLVFRDDLEVPALKIVSGLAVPVKALRMPNAVEEASGGAHI